jgi:antitoxin component YwqK of YwqJK toxin-antitoxin module
MNSYLIILFSIITISCAGISVKPGPENRKQAFSLGLDGNKIIRYEKYPKTFLSKGQGEVEYKCNANPCVQSELDTLPESKIKDLTKNGFWMEYSQKEKPNQSDVPEEKKERYTVLQRSGDYKNNLKEGVWKEFREEGPVMRTTTFVGGKKNGPEVKFNKEGIEIESVVFVDDQKEGAYWKKEEKSLLLEEEGTFSKGKQVGTWKVYYVRDEKGSPLTQNSLKEEMECKDNWIHGKDTAYHPNGNKMLEGNLDMGRRKGLFKFFDSSGTLTMEGNYQPLTEPELKQDACGRDNLMADPGDARPANKKVGLWKFYHSNGNLFSEGNMDGFKVGVWTYYNSQGKKRVLGKMKNDVSLEEGEIYNDQDQLIGKGNFQFSVIKLDEKVKELSHTFKPGVPYSFFENNQMVYEIRRDKDGSVYGIQYENGSELGRGPVDEASKKKNGCWSYPGGKKKYFLLDKENDKMGKQNNCG